MKIRDCLVLIVFVFAYLALISGCSTTQIPSSRQAFEITNSRWTLIYETPQFGKREYDIVCHPDGRLEDLHPNNSTPDNDFWEQQGEIIILRKNDGFAIYEGRIIDENTMSGTAKSKTAGTWQWRAIRK